MNRVVPGLIMAVAWILLACGPAWLFGLVILGVAFLALREYFGMTLAEVQADHRLLASLCSLAPVFAALDGSPRSVLFGLVLALFALLGLCMVLYGKLEDLPRFLGLSGLAALYVGLCGACLVLLAHAPHKSLWLIVLVAVTAGSDTGAYYAGRRFGTRKLFPVLSPKKTWEGLWGGLAGGVAAALLIHTLMRGPLGFFTLIPGAVALVLVGVAGDLAESMLKRACGVKDSGTILAGHGGVLDRVDSLLLAAPAMYAFLAMQGLL